MELRKSFGVDIAKGLNENTTLREILALTLGHSRSK